MSTDSRGPHGRRTDALAREPSGALIKLGYMAWIVYGLLAGNDRWQSAGLAGVALMSVVVAAEYRRRAVKLMDCTSWSYFAAEALIVLVTGTAFIRHYHLVLVWGVFAVVAWLTLIVGAPFTLQYTREHMSSAARDDPAFYQMNRRLTVVWSLIFTLGAVLGAIVMKYGHTVPLGLIVPMAAMGCGMVFSRLYSRRYTARFASADQALPNALPRRDQPASTCV
jgi:F0F1-type ATP synthase assembly protein I